MAKRKTRIEAPARRLDLKRDGHYDGATTGCDVRDGKAYIAPCHKQAYLKIVDEKKGVDELVAAVGEYASRRLAQIHAAERDWWVRLSEDLGFDPGENWQYEACSGALTKPEKEKDGRADAR